jgi:hypothetical protein
MNAIPWLADLQDLSSAEFGFLFLAVIIGCMVTGFIVDLIMRDLGLTLQLHLFSISESMGHHDSEIMDDRGIDRGDA